MTTHITTPLQLQAINLDLTEDYILDNDLDMTGFAFTPLGISTPFTGTLDGQNFTISNLSIDDTLGLIGYTCLFADLEAGAVVQNVNLDVVEFIVNHGTTFAAVCAYGDGATISNCHVTGLTVTDDGNGGNFNTNAGFIAFGANMTISNCSVIGSLELSGGAFAFIAGFIAYSDVGNVISDNCFSSVAITLIGVSSIQYIGGFTGYSEGNIVSEIYATGDLNLEIAPSSGNQMDFIGGLVGGCDSEDSYSKCYATGSITCALDIANCAGIGGGFGVVDCSSDPTLGVRISNVYVTGAVIVTGTPEFAFGTGGFVGEIVTRYGGVSTDLIFKNCYSSGDVVGIGSVGGFFGEIEMYDPNPFQIINCYSVGIVSATPQGEGSDIRGVGGFGGGILSNGEEMTFENCAWWDGASGQAVGYYDADAAAIATLTEKSWGTDESDKTSFYSKDHAVYAQGT